MTGYRIVNLIDLVNEYGESEVRRLLSSFSCPLNKDVEKYLHEKAILYAKQGISPTFLVYGSYKEKPVFIAYFTVTSKTFTIRSANVSSKQFRKIKKFGKYNFEFKHCEVTAPLIAQIGKNFTNDYNKLIQGDELLEMAINKVKEAQKILGGKVVYLECEDKPFLIDFYKSNGFCEFDKRNLDRDEKEDLCGQYLIQMLKYIGEQKSD